MYENKIYDNMNSRIYNDLIFLRKQYREETYRNRNI